MAYMLGWFGLVCSHWLVCSPPILYVQCVCIISDQTITPFAKFFSSSHFTTYTQHTQREIPANNNCINTSHFYVAYTYSMYPRIARYVYCTMSNKYVYCERKKNECGRTMVFRWMEQRVPREEEKIEVTLFI